MTGVSRRRERNLGGSLATRGSGEQGDQRREVVVRERSPPTTTSGAGFREFRSLPPARITLRRTALSPSSRSHSSRRLVASEAEGQNRRRAPTEAGSGRRSRREGREETSPEGTCRSFSRLQLVGSRSLAERDHEGGVDLQNLFRAASTRHGRQATATSLVCSGRVWRSCLGIGLAASG